MMHRPSNKRKTSSGPQQPVAPAPALVVTTAAGIVCRECLPSHGDALSHVVALLAAFLDPLPRENQLFKACKSGYSVRVIAPLAARDPYPNPFRYNVVQAAARAGHVHILRWLSENDEGRGEWQLASQSAALYGRLETIQWLHENRKDCWSTAVMNLAALKGHLDIVQWLHANREEGCTVEAMDEAASHGHLDVVRWLHENRQEGCTTKAMDCATERGHLEVVKWLQANRDDTSHLP
ncbi:hypothetical protein BBJ28_00013521 [Nothophytophthora sp. Chile5]|nr:hypothetical protein BBJ28_00013521 [Nothophytophthora sp. Chile5]